MASTADSDASPNGGRQQAPSPEEVVAECDRLRRELAEARRTILQLQCHAETLRQEWFLAKAQQEEYRRSIKELEKVRHEAEVLRRGIDEGKQLREELQRIKAERDDYRSALFSLLPKEDFTFAAEELREMEQRGFSMDQILAEMGRTAGADRPTIVDVKEVKPLPSHPLASDS
jgi:hypothetical protein